MTLEDDLNRADLENVENWRDIFGAISKTPGIKFDSHWNVFMIPPFAGAVARFIVVDGPATVSVYLDWFERLGMFGGEPYYEIYPDAEDDNRRFGIWETEDMVKAIRNSLEVQLGKAEPDPDSPDGPNTFSISDFFY
jgi:hypothetical protein